MTFERRLILNRWLHHRFGASSTDEILDRLRQPEPGAGGESQWVRALLRADDVRVDEDRLRAYDERVLTYQSRFSARRGAFAWKPFQYLALLYTELLFDELTSGPDSLVTRVNAFLESERAHDPALEAVPAFVAPELRRLAFFMATGSGKTLVMHANIWQVLHYLQEGRHPEALVDRPDGRAEFDNLLLVTPTETLSRQHLAEFRESGIPATHLAYDGEVSGWLFDPPVRVIEIHKLQPAAEVSGEGLSVALESLGSNNFVLIDEGHKGVGSGAQTWKKRQEQISGSGLLLEYSATFAQAVASAGRRRESLEMEYGKSIVFDYSYRHFHDDGYGKHFEVLNVQAPQEEQANQLLLGGLLTYYQQLELFEKRRAELRPFNIERPLWVFLGAGVIKGAKRDLSDVAIVVSFIKRFLEDGAWAREGIARILEGATGLRDPDGRDLLLSRLEHLEERQPDQLYAAVLARVFRGAGALEVWELKSAEGELALAVSGGEEGGASYFGVINVGDPRKLARHLEEELGLEARADEIRSSLFEDIERRDSTIHLLIGSRKFIEGWSSWRVSSMGLLNMGRGAGPQVIQLFGRGVRLKGREMSLRRSTLPGYDPSEVPDGLRHLETLYISGWNADYIAAFRKMLEEEELGWEETIPLDLFNNPPQLLVPRPVPGYDVSGETWVLEAGALGVVVDRAPRARVMDAAGGVRTAGVDAPPVGFDEPNVVGLLNLDRLYLDLVSYKQSRSRYGNVMIRREALLPLLRQNTLRLPAGAHRDPAALHEGASELLRACLDRFVARKEREAESSKLEPRRLEVRESAVAYRVRGADPNVREQVLQLINDPEQLHRTTTDDVLPRLHIEEHLFSPLLLNPRQYGSREVRVTPAGLVKSEANFIGDLRDYWAAHAEEEHENEHLYVLRNLPHQGVGFFRQSGFYPDFLLWLVGEGGQRLRFVEPHGMHHGGLSGNAGKIEAFEHLDRLNEEQAFRDAGIHLGGFILSDTERADIPGAEELTDEQLRTEHRVISRTAGGMYLRHVLAE